MPNPYSSDLRLRVAKAVEDGKTTREVGEQFQVSPSFVSKMHRLWKTSGSVQGKQIGGYRVSRLEGNPLNLSLTSWFVGVFTMRFWVLWPKLGGTIHETDSILG